jgi:hypothetical protein
MATVVADSRSRPEWLASWHCVLDLVAKDNREWRKFGWVIAYLIVFYLIMRFVFHFQ